MRAGKVQTSLCIRAVSPEPSLLAHTSSESRGTFRQKTRSLAPLNSWACAVEICHDGLLEDTNSLDGAQLVPFDPGYISHALKSNSCKQRGPNRVVQRSRQRGPNRGNILHTLTETDTTMRIFFPTNEISTGYNPIKFLNCLQKRANNFGHILFHLFRSSRFRTYFCEPCHLLFAVGQNFLDFDEQTFN